MSRIARDDVGCVPREAVESEPDRDPGDPDAAPRYRRVNCACRALTDGTQCNEADVTRSTSCQTRGVPTFGCGKQSSFNRGLFV